MTNSTPCYQPGVKCGFPHFSGVLQFRGCSRARLRILYDSEYSDEPTHQALFRLLVMRVGAAVPRGPTARAVPPGTDVPACADHIAEELIAVVDLAVLLVIRKNLLTEHELVAAVPVFDCDKPRHAGQGDQQTAEAVVVQLPVLGEQRHPSAAILPPKSRQLKMI